MGSLRANGSCVIVTTFEIINARNAQNPIKLTMTIGKTKEQENLGIKEILQINATIIAGSLVLLTISSLNETVFNPQENKDMIAQVVMGFLVLFGLSSLAALLNVPRVARWAMTGGFFFIITTGVWLLLVMRLK